MAVVPFNCNKIKRTFWPFTMKDKTDGEKVVEKGKKLVVRMPQKGVFEAIKALDTMDEDNPSIEDTDAIYNLLAAVLNNNMGGITTIDGSTYQGATAKERHIDLIVEMDSNYSENRNLLYRCFPIKRTGTMEYIEDGESKVIEYEVEGIIPGEITGVVRDYTISLKCTDPYFKDLADTEVIMASWVSDFFFPACFPEEGRVFGHREADLVKAIENDSGADEIGITVVFKADGIVKNPAIHHMESGEFTKIGYEENDFILSSGQYAVITTHTGKKDIYLIDNVTQAEIEENRNKYGMRLSVCHARKPGFINSVGT